MRLKGYLKAKWSWKLSDPVFKVGFPGKCFMYACILQAGVYG